MDLLNQMSDVGFVRGIRLKKAIAQALELFAKKSELDNYLKTAAALEILADYLTIEAAQNAALNYERKDVSQIEVPTTGGTAGAAAGTSVLILNPATALAALTVNLPAEPTRGDLCRLELLSVRAITALTMSAGAATLRGPLTTIAANGFARWRWIASDTTWLRCG